MELACEEFAQRRLLVDRNLSRTGVGNHTDADHIVGAGGRRGGDGNKTARQS